MPTVIQESDVLKRVDLIVSLADSISGGVANNFTMQFKLNHLKQYNDREIYLVLDNGVFIPTLEVNDNLFPVILTCDGIQKENDIQGTKAPNMLCFIRYDRSATASTTRSNHNFTQMIGDFNFVYPLRCIPEDRLTFKLLENDYSLADTIGGAQLYSAIHLKFTLYIMKQKR